MPPKAQFFPSPSAWRAWLEKHHTQAEELSCKIRFTPRRPRSVWSAINVKRATELSTLGLMHPVGLAAFQNRAGKQSEIYSYEQRKTAKLPPRYEKEFRTHADA